MGSREDCKEFEKSRCILSTPYISAVVNTVSVCICDSIVISPHSQEPRAPEGCSVKTPPHCAVLYEKENEVSSGSCGIPQAPLSAAVLRVVSSIQFLHKTRVSSPFSQVRKGSFQDTMWQRRRHSGGAEHRARLSRCTGDRAVLPPGPP